MKKVIYVIMPIIALVILVTNCNRKVNANTITESANKTAKLMTYTKNGITVTEFYSPEQFADATIAQSTSGSSSELLDENKISINYTTTNYELKKQTSSAGLKSCANATGGQHIHCIIDNEPYNALYDDIATVKAKGDGQHTVLSFLSRSYHESIKNKNAYSLTSVITGKSRYVTRYATPILDQPMLFYSRPKGEYKGGETEAVLLDFYIVNCDLSEKGYKVKAEINGTEFMLTKWSGYFMEGLPLGENTIKLTLLDSKGKQVESPFSFSERKFTLSK